MFNSSSDNAPESKSPRPGGANHDTSNAEQQSDYYYDDTTGYEIYEDKDDDEEDEDTEPRTVVSGIKSFRSIADSLTHSLPFAVL